MVIESDVAAKIKELEIYAKRLLAGASISQHTATAYGSGLEFEQLREYQPGDDVRFIDWSSSARSNNTMIRQYLEERNRTLLFLVDGSASGLYSTSTQQSKYEMIATIASVLALAGVYSKDSVSLVIFNDERQEVVPVTRSARKLMEKLFTYKPHGRTDINAALEYLLKFKRRDTIVFLISDFIAPDFKKNLYSVANRYETIAITCKDSAEKHVPVNAFVQTEDIETGEQATLDFRSSAMHDFFKQQEENLNTMFYRARVDRLDLTVGTSYIPALIAFFRRRMLSA